MVQQPVWADRGRSVRLDVPEGAVRACCMAVSRLGVAQLDATHFTILVQVRGGSWLESREGRFRLEAGDWMALEKGSRTMLKADRHGLCIGLQLMPDALRSLSGFGDVALYAGRGHANARNIRIALRLWRDGNERLATRDEDPSALTPILLHLVAIQQEIAARIPRCPGRTHGRKRHVFGRLQRARLYLEGNCDRVVRMSELVELTSFSSQYLSKTFHDLYDESPQTAGARMRLEHAARLLRTSAMMIGEVGAASGFDNCCSFARAFRARYGMSATSYRAGTRANSPADVRPVKLTPACVRNAGSNR